jgi:tRNA(His) guanylyltransferase
MKLTDLDREQRAREWFHSLTAPPGAWIVIRVDGRSFTGLTNKHFEKPFDERFSELMVACARALLIEFEGLYAYTESDEVSVLLPPKYRGFDRDVEKLVSVSAGIASAAFTHAAGVPGHFDSRLWVGNGIDDVRDYFSWRQADAARCGLNGWAYWTLRKAGKGVKEATAALHRATESEKHELLFGHDVNFAKLPAWQRRGIGLWWSSTMRDGFDPVRQVPVQTRRRSVHVERDLPMRNEYRALVQELAVGRDVFVEADAEQTDDIVRAEGRAGGLVGSDEGSGLARPPGRGAETER